MLYIATFDAKVSIHKKSIVLAMTLLDDDWMC